MYNASKLTDSSDPINPINIWIRVDSLEFNSTLNQGNIFLVLSNSYSYTFLRDICKQYSPRFDAAFHQCYSVCLYRNFIKKWNKILKSHLKPL